MSASPPPLELSSPPALGVQLLRAAFARKPARADDVPRLELRVRHFPVDASRLARYREVCGFEAEGFLPPLFPQVLATPLHLALLNRPEFPYPLMGMIHVRNLIRQHRRLSERATLWVSAWVEGRREVRLGHEVDLHTHVGMDGTLVWEAVTTMLRRLPHGEGGLRETRHTVPATAPVVDEALLCDSRPARWEVPAGMGWRYARASGDYNPLHLTALTARPFGFQRAIAHGMWTLGRCVAEMGEAAQVSALTLTADFRRPLLLPARVQFQTARQGDSVVFRAASEEGKAHLVGRLLQKAE